MRPFVLIQISDLHIGASWPAGDPLHTLEAAVAAVNDFPEPPDAVLVSGDLTETGAEADYELAREMLSELRAPLHVIPGNHDERRALRRAFGLPGEGADPIQYAVDLGPLRLLALDTIRPGNDAGELDAERLAWLEAELGREPGRPTLIALHHPPLAIGIGVWDEIGLSAAGREGLERVVAANPRSSASSPVTSTVPSSVSSAAARRWRSRASTSRPGSHSTWRRSSSPPTLPPSPSTP